MERSWFEKYKSNVPEGKSGNVSVEKFEVSKSDSSFSMITMMNNEGRGFVVPGTYTRMLIDGHLWMSDTPDEIKDHIGFIHRARGNVLITGLGLGVVASAVAAKDNVSHVTVVEINADVISLVADHLHTKHPGKITVIEADALTWKPPKGTRYDFGWHDIWQDICADNYESMKTMHRRYGRRVDNQASWCRPLIERMVRESKAWEKELEYWKRARDAADTAKGSTAGFKT